MKLQVLQEVQFKCPGGTGGLTKGVYEIEKKTTVYVYIGGVSTSTPIRILGLSNLGGYNGGGNGGEDRGGGGGGTDIRTLWVTNKNILSLE